MYNGPSAGGTRIPSNWDPIIFSQKVMENEHDNVILEKLCNREYEGELRGPGSKLIIRKTPVMQAQPFVKGAPFTPQTVDADSIEVFVKKGLTVPFAINDFDEMNSDIKGWMNKYAREALFAIADKKETMFFEEITSYGDVANTGATAGKRSQKFNLGTVDAPLKLLADGTDYNPTNVTEDAAKAICDADTVLAEQVGYSSTGKWIVVPPAVANLIRKSPVFVNAAASGESQTLLRKDVVSIGNLAGFTVYQSNNLYMQTNTSSATVWDIPFGDTRAIAYASVVDRTDILKDPYIIGQQNHVTTTVFDWFCLRPEHMGHMLITL